VIGIAALLAIALAAWIGYSVGAGRDSGPSCGSPVSVAIAAAPEIAPALGHIAADLAPEQRSDGTTCYLYQVFGQDPAQVSAALTKTGITPADVWVPDSTYWLRQVAAVNLEVPQQGQSIASSPVVLAMPEPAAARFGYPAKPLTWGPVLARARSAENAVSIGITDPATSPVGLYGLLAVRDTVHQSGGSTAAQTTERTAVLRAMSGNVDPPTQDIVDQLRRAAPGGLSAAPVREQAVIQYDLGSPSVPMVGAYSPASGALDYPYVVLPQASAAARAAAQKFLAAVLAADPRELASRGFRTPDGSLASGFPQQRWVDTKAVRDAPLPPDNVVNLVLGEWAGVNRSGRILTVIDVSGSMNEPVPGTTSTRMELTKQAARLGLGLFKPTTEAGLWIFSTDLSPGKDYQELVPIQPLYNVRELSNAKIGQIQAKPDGSTGLYDTVLAGYQTLRRGWNPGRINVLVVFTDGQNEDPNGITRAALLAQLKKLSDPKRPLPIVMIGLGPGVNKQELTAITTATGGYAFITPDPRKIREIFLTALAAFQSPTGAPPKR
jgi:ABC-type molybdate transport system substrate-binding protein